MVAVADVQPSPIVGRWYPREPGRLARSVDAYLDSARLPDLGGTVVAVMAPHAGHAYSGPVAGHALAAVRGSARELVAVVGPMHDYHPEMLLGTGHQAYGTPLGIVPVDQAARHAISAPMRPASCVTPRPRMSRASARRSRAMARRSCFAGHEVPAASEEGHDEHPITGQG